MIRMISESDLKNKLKRKHGISGNEQDELIEDILSDTIDHYLAIVNQLSDQAITTVPQKHSFIISDVASIRYVRRGSEGMEVERVDGYQAHYQSAKHDFDSYLGIMEKEYKSNGRESGRVTFY